MPNHAVADFFTYGNPEQVFILMILQYIHDQIPVGAGNAFFVNLLELPVLSQRLRKSHEIVSIEKIGHKTAAYADNLFLPFALLAANTFLPPALLILALKPCTLERCLFLGWNVIFMKATPPFQALSAIRHIYDMYRKISLTLYRQKFDKSSNFLYFKGFLNRENFSTKFFSKSLFYTIQDIVIEKKIFPQDLVYKHLWIFESTDPQIYITLSTKCGKLVDNPVFIPTLTTESPENTMCICVFYLST